MKRKAILFVSLAVVVFSMACQSARYPRTAAADFTNDSSLVSYAPLWAAVYQQKAAEYKALSLQAYNIAYERLDALLQQPKTKPFAVVTDVDETVLDNSPYTVHQSLLHRQYNDTSWTRWTSLEQADTVPGALSFFRYASSKQVEVFYITNRSSAEKAHTIANLKKWDFPDADSVHVLTKTTTSGKDQRRAQVAQTHDVLLWFGDNLGDFMGTFDHQTGARRDSLVTQQSAAFGKRFIVLPNPMYGEWQNALIRYNYTMGDKAKADSIIRALKNY